MFEKWGPESAYNIYILISIDNAFYAFYECFKDLCKQCN